MRLKGAKWRSRVGLTNRRDKKVTASGYSRVRKWLYESTVWTGKGVARNRDTWQHVDDMSERRQLMEHARVISSQFWDSNNNELISDLWFDTAVNSGMQTGICYGIAFHCSVMVVWVENSSYASAEPSWHRLTSLQFTDTHLAHCD